MKKYGFPFQEINRFIASIKGPIVKSVTNSCGSTSKYKYIALYNSADFEKLSRTYNGPA